MAGLLLRGLLLAACLAACAHALYEDQAGSFDWYKQQLGLVERAVFHSIKPRVCVSTQQAVVGCVNLRDGTPAWRKLFPQPAAALAYVEQHGVLIAAADGVVRALDFEGFLKWEKRLVPETRLIAGAPAVAAALLRKPDDAKASTATVVVSQGYLKVFNTATGKELYTSGLPYPELASKQQLLVAHVGDVLAVLAFSPGDTSVVALTPVDPASLDKEWTVSAIASPQPLSATASASDGAFAAVSSDGQSVCTGSTAGGALPAQLSCTALSSLDSKAGALPAEALALVATPTGAVLLSTDQARPGALLLSVSAGGEAAGVKWWDDVVGATPTVRSDRGQVLGLVSIAPDAAVQLRVVDAATGEVVLQEAPVPHAAGGERHTKDSAAPRVAAAFLGTYRKKDRTDGYRLLLSLSDGHLALLQQGVLVWAREEALAGVTSSLFADLPAPRAASAAALEAAERPDFKTRLRAQVLGAKVQLKLNTPDEATELAVLREALSDKAAAVRDVNGFRKLLLATTAPGKLVALHNGDGRLLWARNYPPGQGPQRALRWRVFHDITHAPQVLLLHGGPAPFATVVDAHTGAELERLALPFAHDRIVPIHDTLHDGSAEQSVYLVVGPPGAAGAPPAVHLLPDTPASRSYFAEHYRGIYLAERGQGSRSLLVGYGFTAAAAGDALAGRAVALEPVWRLDLGEPILAMATRDAGEAIPSSVKVLGDRSIRYRYLNPNTLLVATGTPPGEPDAPDAVVTGVTAHVVDTATGRVLHRQLHDGGRGPVVAAVSENLGLLMYWDAQGARFVASSLELYDDSSRTFSVLDYLFNPNATRPVSSFTATPIVVSTQVFGVMGYQPRAIALTRTQLGLTAKQFLVLTEQDQVYTIDPRLVDPRRPKKAKLSAEEMEERLIPYHEQLPVNPVAFATYDKQVLGLSGVVVEPSRLESTCLMFAHGVDLFYTRLAPSRAFDSLEDDFNYALLIFALLALTVGAVAMHYAVKQAGLKQKWK